MRIEEILAKDIDRNLDGVVKASNFAQLQTEVDEYVVTDEVARHLSELLEAYTHPGDPRSNGVWIAGFFGSGKSHLLKMLAHLLGDVEGAGVGRDDVVTAFSNKIPADDGFLKAAIDRSAKIPARSLLFNIDEKVDKHEKEQADALLKVFVQVFYDACGFFGKSAHIARFERDLSALGVYNQFREAFARHYPKSWEEGRELAVFAEPAAELAYAEVTGTALAKPLTAYRESYSVSIESFAEEVADWLSEQSETAIRLNFFVDEIGQFIGQDTKLMLSLQTIAETLFTRCNGRAWVVVTSQEIMDSIIGDRTRQQEMDFSKIQARFAVQLKLDSKNVREVVSKRLLAKTPEGANNLGRIYKTNSDRFRSLFAFQNQRTYQNYATVGDFVGTYPFVDYQFELFHTAMKGLSDYNAFTGRHASVGERSLLGVTKEIGSAMKSSEVGALATFDMFFDGIEKSVLGDVKRNVHLATQHLEGPDSPLAVRVLKSLLMTKYVDQFEASAQSLAVLLTPAIDTNVAALREDIERALQLLVMNTYVQRTGTTYTYLTNEEQDVEKAIKAFDRNDAAIKKLLNEEIVTASGTGAKVRHDSTGIDLGIERSLDGERQGRSEQLAVHFLTPLGGYTAEDVTFQSLGKAGIVFVVLDLDQSTLDDIDLLIRTRDYVQLQFRSTLPESRRRILDSHQRHNQERQREVMKEVRQAVTDARLIHNGNQLAVAAGSAKDRVHAAMQIAIESRYTRINEARGVAKFKDTDLARILRDEITLDIEVTSSLDALAKAVMVQLRQAKSRQVTTYVGSLVDNFALPPFGWSMTAVLVALAHAVKTDRVRLQLDTRTLVRTEVAAELRNTMKHKHIVVDEIREHDPSKVAMLRAFLVEYRDVSDAPSTAEELVRRVRSAFTEDLAQVSGWTALDYPFGPDIDRAEAAIRTAAEGHPDDWYLDGFLTHKDDLLNLKEDVLDPIRGFLKGSQRTIVDRAREFLVQESTELDAANDHEVAELDRSLKSPNFFRGNAIPQIKQLHLKLQGRVAEVLEADRVGLRSRIETRFEGLQRETLFTGASPTAQEQALASFAKILGAIDTLNSRGNIALANTKFDSQYSSIVDRLITSVSETEPKDDDQDGQRPKTKTAQPEKTTIQLAAIALQDAPSVISSLTHVNSYLDSLRTRLTTEITNGKTILK